MANKNKQLAFVPGSAFSGTSEGIGWTEWFINGCLNEQEETGKPWTPGFEIGLVGKTRQNKEKLTEEEQKAMAWDDNAPMQF